MSKKDIFSKPFDDGTKAKLEIFKLYLKEWLPVFLSPYEKKYWDTIFIYDFFAGEGKDILGNYGSPLIILEALNEFKELVEKTQVKIKIVLNEKDPKCFQTLKTNIEGFEFNNEKITLVYYNLSFKDFFNKVYPIMIQRNELPRLMFLDQFGIKEITKDIFTKLISFKRTDFIFFISSSFIRRFNELDEFKSYISIKKEKFDESRPFHSHKIVFEYYQSLITTDYKISPFSIKKERNIYGLIFGSNHSFGLEKFLKVAWKINPHTGDANFNIDEESLVIGQLSVFEEDNKIKKISLYENNLREQILSKKIKTLHHAYLFTLEFGCLPRHCSKLINDLVKEKKIEYVQTINQKIHNLANNKDVNLVIK